MKAMSISEVRNTLPEILKNMQVSRETITILRYGKPIANLVPFTGPPSQSEKYPLRKTPIKLSEDFDEPIPELWDALKR